MKMKEVCAQTGLTERAVRFYLEKGLLSPQSYRKNGRTYFEFTDADISSLRQIAALRRYGFTVEEIGTMAEHGEQTEMLLKARIQALEAESADAAKRAELLRRLPQHFSDGASLGNALLRMEQNTGTESIIPDFGKLDEDCLTDAEKRVLAREAEKRLDRYSRIRRLLAGAAVLLLVIGAGLFGKNLAESRRTFSMVSCIAGPVLFSDLTHRDAPDGDEVLLCAEVSTLEGDFTGAFADSALYNSLFADTPYAMVGIAMDIPEKELAALGFDPELAGQQAEEIKSRILADEELSLRYLRVITVQAES